VELRTKKGLLVKASLKKKVLVKANVHLFSVREMEGYFVAP
jgi:hypothetical protein